MNDLFKPAVALDTLKLPPQDIELLTFCTSNKAVKVTQWVSELKLTQIKPASVALYDALPEINRLKTDVKTRFDMLEALWAATQQSCQGLARDFLQQPLILPPNAQKTAILAQALQKHLLDGYCLCIKELTALKKLKPQFKEVLKQSLFRANLCISAMFFRCYQLYSQAPINMWKQLHTLYQIAEYYELLNERMPASLANAPALKTINETYIHALAMSSIRPNQLSQNDIAAAFEALDYWVKHISLSNGSSSNDDPLFMVNLSSDAGPAHKTRFHCDQYDRVLELDFEAVANMLSKNSPAQYDSPDSTAGPSSPTLPMSLQVHIIECWSNTPERLRERKRADIEAKACVGLMDCHKQICGDVAFEQFLNPRDDMDEGESSLLSSNFNNLVNSLSRKKDIDAQKPTKQAVADVLVQNVSAGGYCLLWQGILGNRVEAGELIAVREEGRRTWNLGVIRWIRKLKSGSQLGVQLLSTQPVPYGAAFMYDMGGYSDYMRALHIPAPASAEYPPSLLTASVPFQENSRVRLKQEDTELEVRLTKCVLSTSKIRLFAFDTLSSDDSH